MPIAGNELRPAQVSLRWQRALELGLLLAVVALAAALRFHHLSGRSFWIDEGASIAIARLDTWNFLRILWRREANMGFYYLLLRGWLLLGSSELAVRSLSAILGVGAVPAIYFLGRQLWDRKTGLLAAFLLAVNGYHIRYSQEARGYSLVVLLALLSCIRLVGMIQRRTERRGWAYAAVSALAVYTHFYALLALLAQWASLLLPGNGELLPRQELKRLVRKVLLLLLPAALFVVSTGKGPINWLQRPGPRQAQIFWMHLTGSGGSAMALLYLGCVVLAAVAAVKARRERGTLFAWRYDLVFSWLLLPVAVTFAVSMLQPAFLDRFLLVCVPAVCLLAAVGILHLRPRILPAAFMVTLAALAMKADLSFQKTGIDQPQEDWRAATRYILERAQPNDAVGFYTAQGRMPYEVYAGRWDGPRPAVVFPAHGPQLTYQDFMGKPASEQVAGLSAHYERVWLVTSHNQTANGVDAATQSIESVLAKSYGVAASQTFPGIEIRLYARAAR